jgi:hypothetical protein
VCILDVMITSRYCSREDICKLIIVDSESFNWTRSCGFSLHTGGFSTYKFWYLACGGCWIYFSALFLGELIFLVLD